MVPTTQTAVCLAAFCAWAVTSFFCHKLAKMALEFFVSHVTSLPPSLGPIVVTLCQILCCYATNQRNWKTAGLFVVVASSHIAATMATNASLYMLFASSTMAVKLLEPVTSSMIQSLVLKTKMSFESVLAMPVIIAGAFLFVGDPFQSSVVTDGIVLALFSNVVLGIRNVGMKVEQISQDHGVIHIQFRSVLRVTFAALLAVGATRILEASVHTFPKGLSYFLFLSFLSGGFHVAYSYISTSVILLHMTVVGHAVANILKRVLVVVLLHVSGRRQASFWNWLGLVMCTCGLCLYNLRKISSAISSPHVSAPPKSRVTGPNIHDSHSDTRKRNLLNLLLFVTLITLGVVEITIKWDRLVPRPFSSYTEDSEPVTTRKTSPKAILSLSTTNAPEMALFSKIVHVQPLGPKNATRDYAKDLRHGFVKWRDGKALVDTSIVYQPERKPTSDVQAFLKKQGIEMSQDSDGLSPYLKTSGEVIAEAERVHKRLLSDLIGDKKYAVLIGATASQNKGDSAITIGEVMILEKLHVELLYYIRNSPCADKKFERAKKLLAAHATDEVVILMQGGGNLIGYKKEDNCRKKAFEAFPDHKTILLSQSFYMSGSNETVDQRVEMYCCNPKLTILLRDRLSLYIAKRMFTNGTKLLLAPDMAYAIGPISRFSPPLYDIMWLHRSDRESPMYNYSLPAFPPYLSVRKSDWLNWASPTGTSTVESAHNELMNGLLFLQRGRVVVTDRLHGHILCVLLNIPHVLLDNADNKLSSYYNTWTRGLANTRLTDNPQDAARLAMKLLETYGEGLPPTLKSYQAEE